MSLVIPPAPIIVDASITVGSAVGQEPALRAIVSWSDSDAMVLAPPLLWLETANALVRGHRFSAADALRILGTLRATGIESADRGSDGLEGAIVLAERHRLSVYDATYLWLAIDMGGELATLDADLARAAEAEGVALAIPPGT
jgi:predicted nucleic acid-binding protein